MVDVELNLLLSSENARRDQGASASSGGWLASMWPLGSNDVDLSHLQKSLTYEASYVAFLDPK